MGIYLKHGNYYIDYYVEGRRVREKVGTSKRQAEQVLAVRRGEILQGRFKLADHQPSPRFAEFADQYMEFSKSNKRSWRRDHVSLKVLTPFFGTRRLKEITPWLIERYKTERKPLVAPASVNLELACLKHMFSMAIQWGKVDSNPVKRVKFMRLDNQVERILTAEEEVRLLEHASDRLKPIVLLALNTGMRLGEIIGLTWEQVDWARGAVTLTRTKSGKSRSIPMNRAARAVLDPLRGDGTPTGPVFGKPNSVLAQTRRDFDQVRLAAKLEGLRFHDLRHTFATRLVTRGVDIVTVSKLLGHSTILMTMRYSHPAPEDFRRAVGKLEIGAEPLKVIRKKGQR